MDSVNAGRESLAVQLHGHLAARDWTPEDLYFYVRAAGHTMSLASIRSYLRGDQTRLPREPERYVALAVGFGIEPDELTGYQLAVMRRDLDEREPPAGVGLGRALENLEALQEGLALLAGEPPVGLLPDTGASPTTKRPGRQTTRRQAQRPKSA